MIRTIRATLFFVAVALFGLAPAYAVDGVVLITHAKALAGNVTPGDAPGYPVSLFVPGSYRLASNLSPPQFKNGIDAASVEITIDLNGFRIDGANVASNGIHGSQRNLTVRNGTILRFLDQGIRANGPVLIVEDMRISESRYGAITAVSAYNRILNNTITGNLYYGIRCDDSCHIEGNYIVNSGTGISIATGTILGNTIQDNKAYGIDHYGSGPVGLGNNSLINNAIQVRNGVGINALHPNFCVPAC